MIGLHAPERSEVLCEPSDEVLRQHLAYVAADNRFQRKARLLQARWREKMGYPAGRAGARGLLGSRMAMPQARDELWNYLSPTIRDVVRTDVMEGRASRGTLCQAPRIYDNLLSSQPLCFNLFAELSRDLTLATRVLRRVHGAHVQRVLSIVFEHAPGRGDPVFTAEQSAFDAYIEYEHAEGELGFVAVEVKYHEGMTEEPATHRARYSEVARAMGCFAVEGAIALQKKPINQLWRDHLLAGSLLAAMPGIFRAGCFAVLYPTDNRAVASAISAYRACLTSGESFAVWTLEDFLAVLASEVDAPWVAAVSERYLGCPALSCGQL